MGLRFEFDPENKILLSRFEGQLTNEGMIELYESIRRYAVATGARAGIWDFSAVTEIAATSDLIRSLARQEPAMPDAANRPRFIVAPPGHLFGISRMFQLVGEPKRPQLRVVHTIEEALAALEVLSPHFQPFSL